MSNKAPDPVFAEPWHAQVFALTVHLHDQGRFSWPEWTQRFGATLARHGVSKDLDGGTDYFTAWLATLESLLADGDMAVSQEIGVVASAWAAAYLATPHGQPIRLPDRRGAPPKRPPAHPVPAGPRD